MTSVSRREFLLTAAAVGASGKPDDEKTRLGLVRSNHKRLVRPVSLEDPLDYAIVRDMVWKAIEYGKPRAGSLEAKIRPGAWVVVKPNGSYVAPQSGYRAGDITDLRVTQAVLEYVATKSQARRITLAEGASQRRAGDPGKTDIVVQRGRQVNWFSYEWDGKEYPGMSGSLENLLREMSARFPGKVFDSVDLSYDAVRDPSGKPVRVEVARSARGVGAFGARPDYFITNTVRGCDFLINVPVMKVHDGCGITSTFKSYVGTAPREAYQGNLGFYNMLLHSQHQVEDRIDGLIVDLASVHPPDYSVVCGIRGLQAAVHNIGREDQTVRSNLILAGEDPVAVDRMVAYLSGFNPLDMEFLHMAAKRDMGTMDPRRIEVVGDDPDPGRRYFEKPAPWHGRGNREWTIARHPDSPEAKWTRYTAPTDTLNFAKWAGGAAPGTVFGATARVYAEGHRKTFLWAGIQGRLVASLNGEKVMEEEGRTRYRVGQFQRAIELKPGENVLRFRLEPVSEKALLSVLLVGSRNDGDTAEGIRWMEAS